MLECIGAGTLAAVTVAEVDYAQAYQDSELSTTIHHAVRRLVRQQRLLHPLGDSSTALLLRAPQRPRFTTQLAVCVRRAWRSYWRLPDYQWARLGGTGAMAVILGSVYHFQRQETVADIVGFIALIYIAQTFTACINSTAVLEGACVLVLGYGTTHPHATNPFISPPPPPRHPPRTSDPPGAALLLPGALRQHVPAVGLLPLVAPRGAALRPPRVPPLRIHPLLVLQLQPRPLALRLVRARLLACFLKHAPHPTDTDRLTAHPPPHCIGRFLGFFFLYMAFATAFGQAIAAASPSTQYAQTAYNTIAPVFSIMSGMTFTPSDVPSVWRPLWVLTPFNKAFEGLVTTQWYGDDRGHVAVFNSHTRQFETATRWGVVQWCVSWFCVFVWWMVSPTDPTYVTSRPSRSTTANERPTTHPSTNRFFGGEFAFENRWRNFGVMLVFIGLCQVAFWAALRFRRFEKR